MVLSWKCLFDEPEVCITSSQKQMGRRWLWHIANFMSFKSLPHIDFSELMIRYFIRARSQDLVLPSRTPSLNFLVNSSIFIESEMSGKLSMVEPCLGIHLPDEMCPCSARPAHIMINSCESESRRLRLRAIINCIPCLLE